MDAYLIQLKKLKYQKNFIFKIKGEHYIIGFGVFELIKDDELKKLYNKYFTEWQKIKACNYKLEIKNIKELIENYKKILVGIDKYSKNFDEKKNVKIEELIENLNETEKQDLLEQRKQFVYLTYFENGVVHKYNNEEKCSNKQR